MPQGGVVGTVHEPHSMTVPWTLVPTATLPSYSTYLPTYLPTYLSIYVPASSTVLSHVRIGCPWSLGASHFRPSGSNIIILACRTQQSSICLGTMLYAHPPMAEVTKTACLVFRWLSVYVLHLHLLGLTALHRVAYPTCFCRICVRRPTQQGNCDLTDAFGPTLEAFQSHDQCCGL